MSTPNTPQGINRSYDRTSYLLVVDDDDTLLKFFKIHLNKFFSKVIVVKSVKEALAVIKEKEIDLVISDIRMPKADGLSLMKRVRSYDPTIPVYLVSGAMLDQEQTTQVNENADGFLKKPFTMDELHAFIEQGMARRDMLKALNELVPDKKKVYDLFHGRTNTKTIKDVGTREKVVDIMSVQKKAS